MNYSASRGVAECPPLNPREFPATGYNVAFRGKAHADMEKKSPELSSPSTPLVVPMHTGETFDFGAYGTNWKIDGSQTGGRFAVGRHFGGIISQFLGVCFR